MIIGLKLPCACRGCKKETFICGLYKCGWMVLCFEHWQLIEKCKE